MWYPAGPYGCVGKPKRKPRWSLHTVKPEVAEVFLFFDFRQHFSVRDVVSLCSLLSNTCQQQDSTMGNHCPFCPYGPGNVASIMTIWVLSQTAELRNKNLNAERWTLDAERWTLNAER
jgi:hypothetical protein